MRAAYGHLAAPPRPAWLIVGVPVGARVPRVLAKVCGPLPVAQASAAGFTARGFTRVDLRRQGLS